MFDVHHLIDHALETRATVLDLSYRNITILPSEVGQLTTLTHLDLSGNNLKALPDSLEMLSSLESLDLSQNKFVVLPDVICQLVSLRQLELGDNQLATLPRDIGKLVQLISLDVYNNQLTHIPDTFNQLQSLKLLSFNINQLTTIPKSIFELMSLEVLSLNRNLIHVIPTDIENLKSLCILNLSGNRLAYIPKTLERMEHLSQVDFGHNFIQEWPRFLTKNPSIKLINLSKNPLLKRRKTYLWSRKTSNRSTFTVDSIYDADVTTTLRIDNYPLKQFPGFVLHQKKLKSLKIVHSQLTTIPKKIAQLSELQSLKLYNNAIEHIPEELVLLKQLIHLELPNNRIREIPKYMKQMTQLRVLKLHNNAITVLPREIVDLPYLEYLDLTDNPLVSPPIEIAKQGLEAIRHYFLALDNSLETISVHEAKLIVVGHGGSGKTSLVKKLLDPQSSINLHEEMTHGISIKHWLVPPLTAHVWDFGGQDIYYATHQFFLTKRSLYLLVWEPRKEDDFFLDYWLNTIALLSNNSPVLVVMSKLDQGFRSLDEVHLRKRFPNIVGFVQVSALTGENIDGLKASIQEHIMSLNQQGVSWPKNWMLARKALETSSRVRISYSEFSALLLKYGLLKKDHLIFAQYLHDLGIILHFQDDMMLKDVVLLQPDWLTCGLYLVLSHPVIAKQGGHVSLNMLMDLWKDTPYKGHHLMLIQFMIKFELCFQIPNSYEYVIPDLLPLSLPVLEWKHMTPRLYLEYHYDFIPFGLFTNFMVRNHVFIARNGYSQRSIILEFEDTQAYILLDIHKRSISFDIRGPQYKNMLVLVRKELFHFHRLSNCISVQEMLGCNCPSCYESIPVLYPHHLLKRYLQEGRQTIVCSKSLSDVRIRAILEHIDPVEEESLSSYNFSHKLKSYCTIYRLSKKESELIFLIVRGYSIQEMSEQLFVSQATIKSHLKHIYQKIDVKNRLELLSKIFIDMIDVD